MKNYTDYMNGIAAPAGLRENLPARAARKPARFTPRRAVLACAGAAACLTLVLLGLWGLPERLARPAGIVMPGPVSPGEPGALDLSLTGLPVDNFNLAGLHNNTGVLMDRILLAKLSDFFSLRGPDMFAFVRVTGTTVWRDTNFPVFSKGQSSALQVLEVLWHREGETPVALNARQSLFGGCCAGENTNLLREGGVYLLPLAYWAEEDSWHVYGDWDVLFELDDRGRVWSHSSFEGFSRFDGQDASVLAEAVTLLTADENFPAAATLFGLIVRNWGVLAEVTVLSVTPGADEWGYPQFHYALSADVVHSISAEWRPWQPEAGDEFRAVSYASSYDDFHLEPGGRYLALLDPSEDGPYIERQRIAAINADGTITAFPGDASSPNAFEPFDGLTPEQIGAEAERAQTWHETHAR